MLDFYRRKTTTLIGKKKSPRSLAALEPYAITYLDVADGLASNYVSSNISDYQGTKWLATEGYSNAPSP